MKQLICVLNSDTINRYGQCFTVGALVSALWDIHREGMPLLISHDFTRALGWQYPFAVHFEPGLTRLTGLGLMVEGDQETEQLLDALSSHLMASARNYKTEVASLRERLAPHLSGNEKLVCAKESVALFDEGLVARVFPEIFDDADKDRLVPLKKLEPLGPGVFRIGELALFAHRFFRRSLSTMNTLNRPFLERLQEISNPDVTVRIAIDPDTVGLASTYTDYQELEYWWGPKFTDDLANIPFGVTRHGAGDQDRLFHGISGSEFWWQSRKGEHIFEVEELRDIPSAGEEAKYGCRYAHSIIDENSGRIDHLDGAVRVYSEEEMISRLEQNIAEARRHTDYTKLWRLDGVIPLSLWKALLSDYFRDNHLIGEYFGAKETFEYPARDEVKSKFKELVPYSMKRGDGVRIALSFHDQTEIEAERAVVGLDSLTSNAGTTKYVESWILELEKALVRMGESLFIPEELQFLMNKDLYINFPVILHKNDPRGVVKTIEAFRVLILALTARNLDQVVGFTIAFDIEDREVRVSVLGHINDLEHWFAQPLSVPPSSSEEIVTWAEHVADFLRRSYPIANDNPALAETLKPSGVLLIQRRFLAENIDIQFEETDSGLRYGLLIPDDEKTLREHVSRKEIVPVLGFFKEESMCSHCAESYRSCGCSKMLDPGVAEEILRIQPIRPHWSDRPIY
jgi:hypothetical protein